MKIKAAVVNKINGDYTIENLILAEPHDDEVRVKLIASGICHSDEASRTGDSIMALPGVFGHEGAGIVEHVGREVKNIKVGDHVVMSYSYCGHCHSCRVGRPAACDDWGILNASGAREDKSHVFSKEDGTPVSNFFYQSSFSTHTLTKENNLVVVSKDADLRLIGPLGCGLLTGLGTVINGIKPSPGSSIAIFGTGAVGLASMMAAKIAGCSIIIAVDIHQSRLDIAKELGATHMVDSSKGDTVAQIKDITDGAGVNYSIDTTGVSAVMKSALDAMSSGGTMAPVAVTPNKLDLSTFKQLVISSKKIIGVLMGDTIPQISIPQLIQFHKEGRFPFEKLVKFYKFSEINQARKDSASGKTIKPILIIDESYKI